MNKTLKITLIILAAVVGLAGIGAWYAATSINPAKLTQLLSSSVKEATGRDLNIAGPVSLNIFPAIGIKAEQVSLSNASWAKNPQMLSLKHVELEVKLFPLFAGNVEISSINLVGLDAHLQTNAAGQNNWDLTPTGNLSNSNTVASNPTQSSSDSAAFLAIENIRLSDSRISYQDGNSPVKLIEIPKFTLNGGGSKSTILLDLQYDRYKLGLKGKVD